MIKEGRLTFNAEDLQAHFQKMKTTVYRSKEKVRFEDYEKQIQASYIEEAYAKLIIDLVKVSKVKINNSKLNQIQQNLVLN